MKIKGEKNCKARFRNLGTGPFQLRIEYRNQLVSIYTKQSSEEEFQSCVSFQQDLDFKGLWLITGSSGLTTPDKAVVDSFSLYNLGEQVTQ